MTGARAIIVGGGVGGTVVANRLARAGAGLDVTLVASHATHLYQPGLLDLAIAGGDVQRLERPERALLDPDVRFVEARAAALDPDRRAVRLESGEVLRGDALVIATGARSHPEAIPGFRDGALHFHCPRRAARLAAALASFRGGRIVIGASRLPYKAPPSIVSFALLLEERLRATGLRAKTDLSFVYPIDGVQPNLQPSAQCEALLLARGISVIAPFRVAAIDAGSRRVHEEGGRSLDCDLLVLVPPHRASPAAAASGLGDEAGFIRVDPDTLRTAAPRVWALGDAADIRRPGEPPVTKTGAAARRQAAAVASDVLAELAGRAPAPYDGSGVTIAATGARRGIRIDYRYGRRPNVHPPGRAHYWTKALVDLFYFPMIARS